MNKKIGIWGWWQGNNLGDNWIKNTLSRYFPDAFFLPTTVQDFTGFDYIICGGGGLFIYDVIEPFTQIDIKVPYGIIGMGAEFEHYTNKAIELEKESDFFYVRDQYSIDCMHLPGNCRSYDVTFLNPLPIINEQNINLNKVLFVWRDGHELLRNNKFNEYIKYSDTKEKWNELVDINFADIVKDDFQTNEWDLYTTMKDCGFVISGRYHGIIAAIQRGLPFIAIDICPKIRALLRECGLEEYCVKISEVEKIDELIKKGKNNVHIIREKEKRYVDNARITLMKQLQNITSCITKRLYPIKIIHYGSYWMGENDVINVMADDLAVVSDSTVIDLKEYSNIPDKRIDTIEKTPNGTVCRLNTELINEDIKKYNPDAIVLNSGGLCMNTDLIEILKKKGIVSVGISLSDPDVYKHNGELYGKDFSLFYTNSKYSLNNQYKKNVNIHLLPFAASIKHHYYMPDVEKKFDLVVVGHARKDRIEIVEEIRKICNVGLYGSGWNCGQGVVNGLENVKAINTGKMYLSFSHTLAGFDNVKVGLFEAMACNQFVITSYMDEINDYFEIGKEIVCYHSLDELKELIKYYLEHETEREKIRNAAYLKFLRNHTYVDRWKNVIQDIYYEKRKELL